MPHDKPRHLPPLRSIPLAVAALSLAACSATSELLGGDRIDYRSKAVKTTPLEVPPDLTQLTRDARYQPQAGSVTASTYQSAAAAVASPVAAGGPTTVAVQQRGELRVERSGDQRWLVTKLPPEVLWPRLKTFWEERGFAIAYQNADAGVMETEWAENRAKIPTDVIRNTIGRVLDVLYSTGERDKFRTRIERLPDGGSEVYISHRGMVEVFTTPERDQTKWTTRPSEPQLEADFIARLMVALGSSEPQARTAVAEAPQRPERARVLTGQGGATLQVDEPFDRAWRRVGVALDRAGFTVEDRDRAGGLYFVRYVDPKDAAKSEPGFLSRLFGRAGDGPSGPARYRIAVKGDGSDRTTVSVLDATGAPEAGEVGQRIVAVLVEDLR